MNKAILFCIMVTMIFILCPVPAQAQQTTVVSKPVAKNGWILEHATQTIQYKNGKTKVTFDIKVKNATGRDVDSPWFGAAFTYADGNEGSVGSCVYFPKQSPMTLFKNGASGSTHCGIETEGRKTIKSVRFFYRIGDFSAPEVYFTQ